VELFRRTEAKYDRRGVQVELIMLDGMGDDRARPLWPRNIAAIARQCRRAADRQSPCAARSPAHRLGAIGPFAGWWQICTNLSPRCRQHR
jgi:hypothetical protein